jgi:hypothetical protein
MPYKLRKAPKRELYWVVNTDTGKKHSIEPIPRDRAQRQMNLLRGIEHGFKPTKGYRSPMKGGKKEECESEFLEIIDLHEKLEECKRSKSPIRGGKKSPQKDCCAELKIERRKRKLLEDEYVGDWK